MTGGIVARWGLDRAILSLCAARICRLVLAEAVREEVEMNLLRHAVLNEGGEEILDDYNRLIRLARPEVVPHPKRIDVLVARRLIAHEADVPVLLSAIQAKPDWLLTHNRKHFTSQVAENTCLQIGTPADFFRTLSHERS